MKLFLTTIFTTFCILINAQGINIDSLSHVDYQSLHNTEINDIWGYVDEFGNEYAVVGAEKGVSIVDVTDPQNPNEVYWHSGSESVWRDLKVNGDYAYITTEAQDGLLIIDLSPLPGGAITSTTNYFGDGGSTFWSTAHNLYIDENGYGYIFGANRDAGGVQILDLFTDPMNPVEVGSFQDWYVHDGYVRGDTMYLAHVYAGIISLVDISDKSNPVLLGTKETPSSFAHNIWPSDDGNYVFTTDEVTDAYITAYDITDPTNITEVDRIQSSPGMGIVPHNAHVLGDFLVTSYYADGVVVHDISDPYNMVEIASYDTYPGTSTSTTGCWGAYPFLPSGTLLATDIENGLFILGPDYPYAAKLEGNITNSSTGDPVQGVDVSIVGETQVSQSDLNGDYKTGVANTGVYDVVYERYAYEVETISTTLTEGDTVIQDVQLIPIPDFDFVVNVEDENGDPILDANVRIDHSDNTFDQTTNGLGVADFNLYYDDNYEVVVGKWGYITHCQNLDIDDNTGNITVVLAEGIYDDFTFDYGWSETSNAYSGDWERGVPNGEDVLGNYPNPNIDSPNDCGNYAFVTDNQPTTAGNVQGGTVTLISPVFDVTNHSDPHIYYERWFFSYHGYDPVNDTLKIMLSNGTDIVEIDKQGSVPSDFDKWIPVSTRVEDYITPTANMQLFISTSDSFATPNTTDAGFDHFIVSDGSILNTADSPIKKEDELRVYPNPFSDEFTVEGAGVAEDLILFDLNGKQMNIDVTNLGDDAVLSTVNLSPGIYILKVGDKTRKLVKQ
ncbi:MAG: choice-of-anchor B family protein [Brumimicrobium sp.]